MGSQERRSRSADASHLRGTLKAKQTGLRRRRWERSHLLCDWLAGVCFTRGKHRESQALNGVATHRCRSKPTWSAIMETLRLGGERDCQARGWVNPFFCLSTPYLKGDFSSPGTTWLGSPFGLAHFAKPLRVSVASLVTRCAAARLSSLSCQIADSRRNMKFGFEKNPYTC